MSYLIFATNKKENFVFRSPCDSENEHIPSPEFCFDLIDEWHDPATFDVYFVEENKSGEETYLSVMGQTCRVMGGYDNFGKMNISRSFGKKYPAVDVTISNVEVEEDCYPLFGS